MDLIELKNRLEGVGRHYVSQKELEDGFLAAMKRIESLVQCGDCLEGKVAHRFCSNCLSSHLVSKDWP